MKTFSLLLMLLPCVAHADSVEPDLKKLIRQAEQPKVQYGPARVGWNGPEKVVVAASANPVYESLRADSPAAIRRELRSVLLPDWHVLLALFGLIVGIRLLRASISSSKMETAPNVVPFPASQLPRQEAA